jgi:hypothetical protein
VLLRSPSSSPAALSLSSCRCPAFYRTTGVVIP